MERERGGLCLGLRLDREGNQAENLNEESSKIRIQ